MGVVRDGVCQSLDTALHVNGCYSIRWRIDFTFIPAAIIPYSFFLIKEGRLGITLGKSCDVPAMVLHLRCLSDSGVNFCSCLVGVDVDGPGVSDAGAGSTGMFRMSSMEDFSFSGERGQIWFFSSSGDKEYGSKYSPSPSSIVSLPSSKST